jgi:hypothetical protein
LPEQVHCHRLARPESRITVCPESQQLQAVAEFDLKRVLEGQCLYGGRCLRPDDAHGAQGHLAATAALERGREDRDVLAAIDLQHDPIVARWRAGWYQ